MNAQSTQAEERNIMVAHQKMIRARGIRALRYLAVFLKPSGGLIACGILAIGLTTVVALGFGLALNAVVDTVVAMSKGRPEALDTYLGYGLGLALAYVVGFYFKTYLMELVALRFVRDVRAHLFRHLLGLSNGYFNANSTGVMQTSIMTDVPAIGTAIASEFPTALQSSLVLAGGLTFAFRLNPSFAGYMLLLLPLIFLPVLVFGGGIRRLSSRAQIKIGETGAYAGECLRSMSTIQAYNQQQACGSKFQGLCQQAYETMNNSRQRQGIVGVSTLFLALAGVLLLVWKGVLDINAGKMTAGNLMAFAFFANLIANAGAGLVTVMSKLQAVLGTSMRLVELLDTRSEIVESAEAVSLPSGGAGHVRFENVVFEYRTRPGIRVLNGLNFEVPSRSLVAIVGPSGAGKSTMFDLLLRFYDPVGGTICIDGQDISKVGISALRSRIGLVSQRAELFSGNAWENIRIGKPDATDAEVIAAAKAAHAHLFLENLPQGYDTHLGETGLALSGGQRQRLAIARAIIADPAILLLDEATSALDAESEMLVQEALTSFAQDRTTLVIAHRLATVQHADLILVVDGGQIVATGSHAELLRTCPLYAKLADLQFLSGPVSAISTVNDARSVFTAPVE